MQTSTHPSDKLYATLPQSRAPRCGRSTQQTRTASSDRVDALLEQFTNLGISSVDSPTKHDAILDTVPKILPVKTSKLPLDDATEALENKLRRLSIHHHGPRPLASKEEKKIPIIMSPHAGDFSPYPPRLASQPKLKAKLNLPSKKHIISFR